MALACSGDAARAMRVMDQSNNTRTLPRLYGKLGVAPDASIEAIRSAHKVLEDTYRPGGAYIDDVMHHAYMEIAAAAAILTNPKTRKLYDQGDIDERGKPTEVGLAKASRARKMVLAGAFVAACLGGLLILAFWDAKPSSVRTPKSAGNETAFTPAANPAPSPSVKRQPAPSAPTSAEKDASVAVSDAPRDQTSAPRAPVQADARDYLPPDTVLHSGRDLSGDSIIGGAPHSRISQRNIERNAHKPQRTKQAALPRPGPSRQKLWAGGASQASDPAPVFQSLRTAHCLACLTNHQAECASACP